MQLTIDFAVLSSLMGLVLSGGAIISMIRMPAKKLREQSKALSNGVCVLLHFRLMRECDRVEEQGFITPIQREDIEDIYNAYHALGGNGQGTIARDKALSMPLKTYKEGIKHNELEC